MDIFCLNYSKFWILTIELDFSLKLLLSPPFLCDSTLRYILAHWCGGNEFWKRVKLNIQLDHLLSSNLSITFNRCNEWPGLWLLFTIFFTIHSICTCRYRLVNVTTYTQWFVWSPQFSEKCFTKVKLLENCPLCYINVIEVRRNLMGLLGHCSI